MPRTVLLACLLVLATPLTAWAGGVVRFSGSIVEAPCDAHQPVPGEVLLIGCPMAAQGSVLTVTGLAGARGATLVDKATGTAAGTIAVTAGDLAPDALQFSSHYRIEPDKQHASGTYLISIDYL